MTRSLKRMRLRGGLRVRHPEEQAHAATHGEGYSEVRARMSAKSDRIGSGRSADEVKAWYERTRHDYVHTCFLMNVPDEMIGQLRWRRRMGSFCGALKRETPATLLRSRRRSRLCSSAKRAVL